MLFRRYGALLVLAFPVLAFPIAAQAQMAAPPVEMVDPGASGTRIDLGGVLGNYYPSPLPSPRPAILLLGGSEGGLGSGARRQALSLQAEGYNVLQLAYFRAPNRPDEIARVPLETFDRALDWLKRQSGVQPRSLALVGTSKGAEAALLVTSRRRDITAVVAGAPSSVAWPAFAWGEAPVEGASWTIDGVDVPTLANTRFDPKRGLVSVYDNALVDGPALAHAMIPVEHSQAKVLLVCGGKDAIWPACPMAAQIKERDPRATVLAYADAGHAVFGPPLPDDATGIAGFAKLGGTGITNQAARKDAWPKVLAFLRAALNDRSQ